MSIQSNPTLIRTCCIILVGLSSAIAGRGGGVVHFTNYAPIAELDQRVFRGDDVSLPLAGPDFVAQLFAGADPDSMAPVGDPEPLHTGIGAGYWGGSGTIREIDFAEPGERIFHKTLIWNAAQFETYGHAVTSGGYALETEIGWDEVGAVGGQPSFLTSMRMSSWLSFLPPLSAVALVRSADEPGLLELSYTPTYGDDLKIQWLMQSTDGEWLIVPEESTEHLQVSGIGLSAGTHAFKASVTVPLTGYSVETAAIEIPVNAPTSGGKMVLAQNSEPLVFDTDGITPAGSGYATRVWIGLGGEEVHPAEPIVPLLDAAPGIVAGRVVEYNRLPPGAEVDVVLELIRGAESVFSNRIPLTLGSAADVNVPEVNPAVFLEVNSMGFRGFPLTPPLELMIPKANPAEVGEPLTLEVETQFWCFNCQERVVYEWQRSSGDAKWEAVPESDGATLTIEVFAEADFGDYRAVALIPGEYRIVSTAITIMPYIQDPGADGLVITHLDDGIIEFRWLGLGQLEVAVESSIDLSVWSPLDSVFNDKGDLVVTANSQETQMQMIRLRTTAE